MNLQIIKNTVAGTDYYALRRKNDEGDFEYLTIHLDLWFTRERAFNFCFSKSLDDIRSLKARYIRDTLEKSAHKKTVDEVVE